MTHEWNGISRMLPFDSESENLNVVIETPKGRRTKFKYQEASGLFVFDKMLPLGQAFPFDFGFLPSTIGEDGDPLDALVLTDEPTFVGCLIIAKLLGVIEGEQVENGESKRNDRFIGVPVEQTQTQNGSPQSMGELDPAVAEDITKFFIAYNQLQGKQFKPLRLSGRERAMEMIRTGFVEANRGKETNTNSQSVLRRL